MNKKTNMIILSCILCMSATMFIGCSKQVPKNDKNENTIANKNTNKNTKQQVSKESFKEQYGKYLYKDKNKELRYVGIAEYGHGLKFLETTVTGDKTIYKYRGFMLDGLGEDDGPRNFELVYEVTPDYVKETVKNNDYAKKRKDILNSMIPDFYVLKGKIEVGNKWTQPTKIDNKEYIAETKIIEIKEVKGKKEFKTETTIKGLKGYKEDTYKETRTYRENVGLIYFTQSIANNEFDFGYRLNEQL